MDINIEISKMRERAEDLYFNSHLHCSEAIVYTIKEYIAPEMPDTLVAAATGFAGGIGRTKCACGALTGAIICLGYFFGRTGPTGKDCPKNIKTVTLAAELKAWLTEKHNSACCTFHTKGIDLTTGAHKPHCRVLVGDVIEKLVEMIKNG
ncbi:MAG: C-GCAxxG-C-C family protein [Defluviitaleaceae bacterium]|nr:C-GCAxxG-C-C family protein [Defluviitaleaceae bacterium]